VLKNLIENSIKFTPPGGSVTVRVVRKEEAGDVAITVSDTGVGIPPEHQDRVFERFYQVDPARSGSAGARHGPGPGDREARRSRHGRHGAAPLVARAGDGRHIYGPAERREDRIHFRRCRRRVVTPLVPAGKIS
jgi:light-regulated signal transduction histidine kinase (bacteriophytochrome)